MRVIKLNKTDDIAQVIQYIRDLKDRDIVFELEKGSPLLASSTNMKLMKKTGEFLGKKIRIRTSDPTGRVLAMKAEALEGIEKPESSAKKMPVAKGRVLGDVRPRFSDITRKASVKSMPSAIRPATVPEASEIEPVKSAKKSYIKSVRDRFLSKKDKEALPTKTKKSNFSKIFIITMAVLVLVVFALAVLLPTAQITVYARSEPITRDAEITVNTAATAVDTTGAVIPGALVSRQVSQTKSFPATGSKDIGDKAGGSVVLYNFTKNTLTLRAATTVLTVNGKKFNLVNDITGLRPTAQIGSGDDMEVDRTSLIPPVQVAASQAGADYNIAANTKFAVVNAALGNQNVYAIDEDAITGGTSKTVKIVSQQDLDNAVASMTASIPDQAEADLNSENPSDGDIKILPTGITKQVLAKTANKNAGDQADSFDMTMISKISGLSYKESDVKNLIKQNINQVLSSDKYLLPDAQETVTAIFKSLDLDHGSGVLSVHYETVAAYKVDTSNMPKLLAGKTANEVKDILLQKPEIDRVDVQFSPFFVNKAPKLNGKIYIESKLSQ
ncbi:MAG TPA: hypothetical protein VFX17_03755 [Patescibacteria group bacterium]|nr:hypothetical protein [Patescibacteria group bacterium]